MVAVDTEAYRRLRWQCRRGVLELDLLLGRFLEERYELLDPVEQAAFRELLAQPDPILFAWIQGQNQPPSKFMQIMIKILQ
jgi:antitoxin CptB